MKRILIPEEIFECSISILEATERKASETFWEARELGVVHSRCPSTLQPLLAILVKDFSLLGIL